MLELPESHSLAHQLNQTIKGKTIRKVIVNNSPHKFAWYFGDPTEYDHLLAGKKIGNTIALGGQIEIQAEDTRLVFNDGVNIRYYETTDKLSPKHQLLLYFTDNSCILCSVLMYGGLCAFREGQNENPYYLIAKQKPSPYTDGFTKVYFNELFQTINPKKMSAKAFLATKQRIPGLGNGVLQDILYNARIHPKAKMASLSYEQTDYLYEITKKTLLEMLEKGGRDTEKDIFGQPGGYQTKVSKKTVGTKCPICNELIMKENYLGGSIYYCSGCQFLS